jgi:hypothetical protein
MSHTVIGIDPGVESHGVAKFHEGGVEFSQDMNTSEVMSLFKQNSCIVAVEDFVAMGQRLDHNSIMTVKNIGAIQYVTRPLAHRVVFVPRRHVKMFWTGRMSTSDADVYAAMKMRFGEPGTKASQGILYGVKSHQRAALALAVMVSDYLSGEKGLLTRDVVEIDAMIDRLMELKTLATCLNEARWELE